MKKFVALATAVSLCVPVAGFLTACNPEPTAATEIDLIQGWEVNENEDSQYTPAPQADGSLKISYEKTGSAWQYIKHTLGYEEKDLQNMKTLVIEGSFTNTTDNPVVTYKIEFTGDVAPVEANVYMSSENATYEWDLSASDLTKVNRLLIFTAGADTTGSGELNLKKIKLVADPINTANDYTKSAPSVTPPAHDTNTVTAENVKVGNWYELGSLSNIYTITDEADGVVKVVKNKCNGLTEWASVTADVKGAYLNELKSFKLVVNGGAGLKLKVEAGGLLEAKELTLPAEGDTEIICGIADIGNLNAESVYTIKIFFTWDKYQKGATYNIKSAEFSATPAPVEHVLNTITAENTKVTGWYDNGGTTYTITENEDKTINVVKIANEDWIGVYVDVTGEALKNMASFKVVVNGNIKTFKVESEGNSLFAAVEIPRDQAAVNGENTITVALKDLSELDCSKKYRILMLFNWDNYAEGINYTITSAEFVAKTAE